MKRKQLTIYDFGFTIYDWEIGRFGVCGGR